MRLILRYMQTGKAYFLTPFLLPTLKVGRMQSPPVWAHRRQRTGSLPFSHRTLLLRHDRQAAILEARCSAVGELVVAAPLPLWLLSCGLPEWPLRAGSGLTLTVTLSRISSGSIVGGVQISTVTGSQPLDLKQMEVKVV